MLLNAAAQEHLEAIVAELHDIQQRRDSRLLAPAMLSIIAGLYQAMLSANLKSETEIREAFDTALEIITTPLDGVVIATEPAKPNSKLH